MVEMIKTSSELSFKSFEQAKRCLKGKSVWIVLLSDNLLVKIFNGDMIVLDSDTSFFKCKIKDDDHPFTTEIYLSYKGKLITYSDNAKFFDTPDVAVKYAHRLICHYAQVIKEEKSRIEKILKIKDGGKKCL